MTNSSEILNRKFNREHKAREEAERLLEEKSLELYNANEKLKTVNLQLKNLVYNKTTELTEKELEYKSLVESINDIICRTKLDGTITFVNPIVTKITGYKPEEILGTKLMDYIIPQKKKLITSYFLKHYLEKKCLSYNEFEIVTKTSKTIWIGVNIQFLEEKCNACPEKITALAMQKPILKAKHTCYFKEIIIVARDITRQKLTEELLIRQSRNLEAGYKQQEILSEIAMQLNSLDNFSDKINNFLKKIGEHLKVSRVYIFEDGNNGETTSNTYEWCNNGITPQIEELQDIPYSMIPSWKKILMKDGYVHSEDITKLPDDIRAILEPQEIKSIIVYPLFVQKFFFGFIGFDECVNEKKWLRTELELLKTLSGMIANAYERKISEQYLKESEAKNNAILSSIPDILLHFNREGIILGYHSASKNDLAFSPDLFLGKNIKDLFSPTFSNKVLNAIEKCLKEGSYQFNYELKINGENQHFESRMSKMNNSEVISIARNVSDRVRYEKELKIERDRANTANKAKSEFLANMSHEIRTPMNAILGFSEALYNRMENPQNRKMMKSVLSSGTLLLSLINDILDLSKIEADKLEIKSLPTNLRSVLEEIKLLFTAKASQKEIPIIISVDSNFPNIVLIDEIRIKQIVFNLVGNAIKFTSKGYINISLKIERQKYEKGKIILTVEDTGIGIPLSEQQSIFDAFKQQSGQSNRKYEGTGLGLSISRRLSEKMGGMLTVNSQINKGSVFKLEIPDIEILKYTGEQEEYIENKNNNFIFQKATILVVDDVPVNIELIRNHLSEKDINVISAESGETALDMLRKENPDLILMDILMPGMDGFKTAQNIRNIQNKKHIPIIAFTASNLTIQNNPESSVFDSILYKPITKSKLYEELKQYLKYTNTHNNITEDFDSLNIPTDCPANLKENLTEVIEIINNKLIPEWESIKDSLVLYKIDDFIKNVKILSRDFNIKFLNEYAITLQDDMEIVDLESLKINLDKFSIITDKIKQYNNHNQ